MGTIENSIFSIKKLDDLSYQNTFIHRLDPRIKVITTIVYIIAIVSFSRYQITGLLPFFIYPTFLLYFGNIPAGYLLKKVIIVSPFALFIALFNLFSDTTPFVYLYSFPVTGGMITFVSIMLRFLLTVITTFALIGTMGFMPLCFALTKIGIPSIFAMQLLFLYRYIYVVIEETIRVIRAHHMRSFSKKIKMKTFSYIIGHLLLRTIDRAERIHIAMLSRGFQGKIRINKTLRIRKADILFVLLWIIFFILCRLFDIPVLLGNIFVR
ncbi:MAG: cobalt ECF transporter T component CbiQ [Spirochaetales bacterium]|nr:cobalt ECF transporter T component CbiQ [Spirochaetales bacterium]